MADLVICNGGSDTLRPSLDATSVGPGNQSFPWASAVNTITAYNTTTFDINVAGVAPTIVNNALVQSMILNLGFTMTSLAECTVTLIAPSGERVVLITGAGVFNTSLANATFSTTGANGQVTVGSISVPANGNFIPLGNLASLVGATANGTWKIEVAHLAGAPPGRANGTFTSGAITFLDLSEATYQWSSAFNLSCTACENPEVTASVDTSYQVVATNLFGCTDTGFVNVILDTILPKPILFCGGSTTSSITFRWPSISNAISYQATLNGGTAFTIAAGLDSLQLTGLGLDSCVQLILYPEAGGGCVDGPRDTISCCTRGCLTVDPIVIAASGPTTFCPGQNITLDAGVGVSYQWGGSSTATTKTITPLTSGVYNVTVTDALSCIDTGSISITVAPGPVVGIAATPVNTSLCFGDSVLLEATAGFVTYAWSSGETSATLFAKSGGRYIVSVTDAVGCLGVDSIDVNILAPVAPNLVRINPNCNGAILPTGIITSTPTGGAGTYNYSWSAPITQTSNVVTAVPVGIHTVTVTDVQGCIGEETVTITEPSAISSIITKTDVSCKGGSDGFAFVTASGGTPSILNGYTYNWSNFLTTDTIRNQLAAQYIVTVTDSLGCQHLDTVVIDEPITAVVAAASITSLYSGFNVSCPGTCDGEVVASGTGGTVAVGGNYTFVWGNTQTTSSVTGLCAGLIGVTVTDDLGCQDTTSLTLSEPAALSLSLANQINVSCALGSDGALTVSASSFVGDTYTYNWSNTSTTGTITGLDANTYCVTVTNANGCTIDSCFTITEPTALTVGATVTSNYNGSQVSCNGSCDGTALANGVGGTGAVTYAWSNTLVGATSTGLCAGVYTVTATDFNLCTAVNTVTLVNPSVVSVTAASLPVNCFGGTDGSVSAVASGGTSAAYTYAWSSSSATGTGATVTGLPANTYTVTASDVNSCTATDVITITQPVSGVSLTVVSTPAQCFGSADGTATVTAVGGAGNYTYLWSAGSQTSLTATGLVAGSHCVTVTDQNGCSDSICVTVVDGVEILLTGQTTPISCFGGIDGTATINPTGGAGSFTYVWSSNGQTTTVATGLSAGQNCVTVTDLNGCSMDTCLNVVQPSALSSITFVSLPTNCFGGSDGQLTASITGGTPGYTYTWDNTITGSTITGLTAGTYRVTASDNNGCTVTDVGTVAEPTQLNVTFSVDSVQCNGQANGQAQATVSGGRNPYTYLWSNGATSSINNNLLAGSYTFSVTDNSGCKLSAPITVFEPSTALVASVVARQDVSCNGGSTGQIAVAGFGATPNYTYKWSDGQQGAIATGLSAGIFRVTVADAVGCETTVQDIITEPTRISLTTQVLSNYNGAAISCNGLTDGSVGVIAAGGTTVGVGASAYAYTWSPTGRNTATVNGLPAGKYSVTVTDANGCLNVDSVTLSEPSKLESNFTKVDILCNGDNDGQILVNALAGTGTLGTSGYEYMLSGPNTTGNIYNSTNSYFGLSAGRYYAYVRDGNGCMDTSVIDINEPNPLLVDSVVSTAVLCNSGSTGTASAYASGGTQGTSTSTGYTYLWSNGQTAQVATGLAKGNYQVTISDKNSCDVVGYVSVTEPTALAATVAYAQVACKGGVTSAAVTVTGGTGVYSYFWSNQTGLSSAINLAAGAHSVTVSDVNGCALVKTFTVTEPAQNLAVTTTTTATACNGSLDGTATALGAGGTAPYQYTWSNTQTTAQATALAAGVYTVTLEDSKGCQTTTLATVTEPSAVSITILSTAATKCNSSADGKATVSAAGGTAPYSYLWNTGEVTRVAQSLVSGINTVTVTDRNGCSATLNVSISAPGALVIDSTDASMVTCNSGNNGTATVYVSGGTVSTSYSYKWQASTQVTETVTGLSAGTYAVTITDDNGCSIVSSVVVGEPAQALQAYLNMTPALCNSTSTGALAAVVTGGTPNIGGSYSYNWGTTSNSTTQFADSLGAGVYQMTVTDALGCEKVISQTITEPTVVVANITGKTDVTCFAGNDGTATGLASGGTPSASGYRYIWTDVQGQTTTTATGLVAGKYFLTALDSNGCTGVDSVDLTEPTAVTVNANATNVNCFNGTDGAVNFIASNKTIATYNWDNGSASASVSGLSAGVYTLTATDVDLCEGIFSYTVTEPTALVASIDIVQEVVCKGDSNAVLEAIVSGGTPVYSYKWNNTITSKVYSNVPSATHELVVTDKNGCTETRTITLSEPTSLVLEGNTTGILCTGDSNGIVSLTASGGTLTSVIYEYSVDSVNWQTGDLFTNLTDGIYTAYVRDASGCVAERALTVESADPFFIAAFTADTTIEYLDSMLVMADLNDTVGVNFAWNWSNDTSTLRTDTLAFMLAPVETMIYTFTAENTNGCIVDTTLRINVTKPRRAAAPTAFSPNGDDVNDTFFIQGGSKVESVQVFKVFNRWGELVYEASNAVVNSSATGWDGTFRGQAAESGAYLWVAEVLFKDGHIEVLRGDVTLLR